MAHRNCWFTLLKMVIFYSDVNVYQRVLGPILRQGTHTVFFMFFFGRTPTKHENNVFRLFKLFNTSSTSFCFFFDQNRHGQRPIVVSTWFPARWPFSVAYWSCCFRVRWGLLGRFGRGTWRIKMPFFFKRGVFCPGSFLKSLWVAGPPTIQRQR